MFTILNQSVYIEQYAGSSLESMSDVLIEYKLYIYLIPSKIGGAQVIEHIEH